MTTFSWTFASVKRNGMVFAKTVQESPWFSTSLRLHTKKKKGQETKLPEMGEIEKKCFNQGKRPLERG